MIFKRNVGSEILPELNDSYLVGVKHPGFHLGVTIDWDRDIKKIEFPYERDPEITCHIKQGEGSYYFQGCFNGGRSIEWIEMCDLLSTMIDNDLSKGLIPVWHDESYLNCFQYIKGTYTCSLSCVKRLIKRYSNMGLSS